MSYWATIGVQITDLEMFKQQCAKHGVSYEYVGDDKRQVWYGEGGQHQIAAILTSKSHGTAYLVEDGGSFKLTMDTDIHYSQFAKDVGKNGGKMMRDYTVGVVEKNVARTGGMITNRQEQPDGSVVLRISAMR